MRDKISKLLIVMVMSVLLVGQLTTGNITAQAAVVPPPVGEDNDRPPANSGGNSNNTNDQETPEVDEGDDTVIDMNEVDAAINSYKKKKDEREQNITGEMTNPDLTEDEQANIGIWFDEVNNAREDERSTKFRFISILIGLALVMASLVMIVVAAFGQARGSGHYKVGTLKGRPVYLDFSGLNQQSGNSATIITPADLVKRAGFILVIAVFVINGTFFKLIYWIVFAVFRALEMLKGAF